MDQWKGRRYEAEILHLNDENHDNLMMRRIKYHTPVCAGCSDLLQGSYRPDNDKINCLDNVTTTQLTVKVLHSPLAIDLMRLK